MVPRLLELMTAYLSSTQLLRPPEGQHKTQQAPAAQFSCLCTSAGMELAARALIQMVSIEFTKTALLAVFLQPCRPAMGTFTQHPYLPPAHLFVLNRSYLARECRLLHFGETACRRLLACLTVKVAEIYRWAACTLAAVPSTPAFKCLTSDACLIP